MQLWQQHWCREAERQRGREAERERERESCARTRVAFFFLFGCAFVCSQWLPSMCLCECARVWKTLIATRRVCGLRRSLRVCGMWPGLSVGVFVIPHWNGGPIVAGPKQCPAVDGKRNDVLARVLCGMGLSCQLPSSLDARAKIFWSGNPSNTPPPLRRSPHLSPRLHPPRRGPAVAIGAGNGGNVATPRYPPPHPVVPSTRFTPTRLRDLHTSGGERGPGRGKGRSPQRVFPFGTAPPMSPMFLTLFQGFAFPPLRLLCSISRALLLSRLLHLMPPHAALSPPYGRRQSPPPPLLN